MLLTNFQKSPIFSFLDFGVLKLHDLAKL